MIHHGDLFDVLPTLEAESVDAGVTDPPYGLGFMGKSWDTFRPGETDRKVKANAAAASDNPNLKGRTRSPATSPSAVEYDRSLEGQRRFQTWTEEWAREVLRVLKPGAYLVVCGAPRSYHRMASGLEDAGFEIRDCLAWIFGQGFPKSLNVSIAIDKAAGAMSPRGKAFRVAGAHDPITDAAKALEGWGTALKPAYEPIVLARKPLIGTVAENVLQHGTGAINIDACRIEASQEDIAIQRARTGGVMGADIGNQVYGNGRLRNEAGNPLGRWPANVLLDELAAEMLDEQSGELKSPQGYIRGEGLERTNERTYGNGRGFPRLPDVPSYGDTGGASRFFYIAKPSREERDAGIYDLPERSAFDTVSRDPMSAGANNPRAGAGRTAILNTSELVYIDPTWVNAVLARRLLADTDQSRRKAIAGSAIQCSDGSAWSMCWCGSPSTDPYHSAVKSIIETETSWTTESRISNSSRRPHTNGCMAAAFGVRANGGNLAAYAEFRSPWKQLIGTSRKKAGPSTDGADLATSIASWLTSVPENGGGQRVGARHNFHPT